MATNAEKIAVADFETDPFKMGRGLADDPIEPFCVGFFDGKILETFWGTAKECCLWLIEKSKKHRGIIFMHNGGNFDFHFLLEWLPVENCKFFTIGKRIVEIVTPWGAKFRDSFAIIPKALGAYAKEKIDYRIFERGVRDLPAHRRKILTYLVSDLRNLFDMVMGFIRRFPLTRTLASAVFKLMKTDFGIDPPRVTPSFDATFRPYFFGGRVQFWKLGRCAGRHSMIDINSAYPHAMTFPHWFGAGGQVLSTFPKKNTEQCFFEVDCLSLGALPWRNAQGGVDFPEREGRYQCSGWELLAGLELGRIADLKIRLCYQPAETKDFGRFVRFFYDAKNRAKISGDTAEEFFNKIGLNSGYGIYALQPRRYQEIAVCAFADKPERTPAQVKAGVEWHPKYDDPQRGLSFYARNSYREGIDKFVNVATAASITGCVRAQLLRAIDSCDGVVYTDTDSICAADVSSLPLSSDLGQWKLEKIFPGTKPFASPARPGNSFYVAGKKLYAGFGTDPKGKSEWKTASKGVNLAPKQIVAVALGKVKQTTSRAPTYSVFTPPRFVRRTVRRADQMKKRGDL